MSFVDNFMSHFGDHKDYSKTSRFEVMFFNPSAMSKELPSPEGLRFQCETAELPGYNINTVERKIYGAPEAVAATPVYNDISLTFICAGDLWEKRYFDTWMDSILPKGDYGYTARYREDYVTTISVRSYLETPSTPSLFGVLDSVNSGGRPYLQIPAKPAMEIKLIEAFPTSVAPVTLNWADDAINRLNVTFKYKRWERNDNVDNNISGAIANVFGANIKLPDFKNPFKF